MIQKIHYIKTIDVKEISSENIKKINNGGLMLIQVTLNSGRG